MRYRVYIHTCPNGKKYVGITTQVPEKRWNRGLGYGGNRHFSSTILKYGWDNITHEVFEVGSEGEMYYLEKYLIAYYGTTDPKKGFNHSSGGEKTHLGLKHSEESKRKNAEAHRGKKMPPRSKEYRKKISEIHKGLKHTEETKEKMKEVQKRIHSDPEWKRKQSESKRGKSLSLESREKISKANRGKTRGEETKEKIRLYALSRPKIRIMLQDGTVREMNKASLTRNFINRGIEFEICI